VAARDARAACDARHRVHELKVARRLGASPRSVSSRPERGRFHRWRECRDRISLGARRLQSPADSCRRSRESPGKRNQRVGRSPLGPRREARHLDYPHRGNVQRRYHRPGRELAPGVVLFGALVNPTYPPVARQLQQLEEAARAINQRLFIAKASTDPELDASFASLQREGAGALLVAADPYFDTRRERIIGFAARQRLPAIYQFREYAVAGGLLSYGVSITDSYRQCGVYTAKILKGANPADLPVLTSTKFELVINLKTAKALGLSIPPDVLSLADEVIE